MAIYWGRYAQNFKKIEFKIIQTITDGDIGRTNDTNVFFLNTD